MGLGGATSFLGPVLTHRGLWRLVFYHPVDLGAHFYLGPGSDSGAAKHLHTLLPSSMNGAVPGNGDRTDANRLPGQGLLEVTLESICGFLFTVCCIHAVLLDLATPSLPSEPGT